MRKTLFWSHFILKNHHFTKTCSVQKQGNAEQEALSAGVIESISITVLVGLSVDYVVHLANSYIEADMEDVKKRHPRYKDGPADAELSTAEERELRVFGALEEMGVTVFGGACTSLGASGMLFLCYFQTFFKFGGFMFMTITTSFIFANFFFMPLLSVAGPVGKCCSFADTVSA
eukprot:COSAG06_NODE_2011_length_7849_cov_3.030581_2_plen_174_part_00